MRKKVLSFLMAAALLLSLFSAALAAENAKNPTFSDVPETHWAFTSIEELVARKAINGYPDGNFYPERTVSREEFAKIMVVAAGLTPAPAAVSTYADVPLTYWASAYIETARPYMTAYQNQGQLYFYPTAGALREDIAVAVVKLRGLDPAQADLGLLEAMFSDLSSISAVARPYVALAVEQGIINGYTDGTFRGQGTITRAEAAAILWRAFQQGSGDKVIPDDILPSPTPIPTPAPTPVSTPTPEPEPEGPEIPPQHLFLVSIDRTYTNYVTASVYLPGENETTAVRLVRKDKNDKNIDYTKFEDGLWPYVINSRGYYELVDAGGKDDTTGNVPVPTPAPTPEEPEILLKNHLFLVSVDRTYTNYVTASVYFAGEEELLRVKIARKDTNGKNIDFSRYEGHIWFYTVNSKGYYELLDPAEDEETNGLYLTGQKVGKTSNISVELGTWGNTQEYFITNNSVIIGMDDRGSTYAILGGGVEAGSTVELLVDSEREEVLMLAVTKAPDGQE